MHRKLTIPMAILAATVASTQAAATEATKSREATKPRALSPADLYSQVHEAVVGVTRRDLPRNRPNSRVTHFGTGIIIDPAGLVLTSPTVVPKGSRNVEIYLRGGRVADTDVIAVYPEKEVSLLRVRDFRKFLPQGRTRFARLELGKSSRVGAAVYSFGNAFESIQNDDQVVMGAGVVSGKFELKQDHPESTYRGTVLETTAALNNGMDGGPLVDSHGRLVGLLILNFSRQRWLGTAIPIEVLRPYLTKHRGWLDDRVASGDRASLGVEVAEIDGTSRIHVLAVAKDGPAAAAGLKAGDSIRRVDGKPVRNVVQLVDVLKALKAGEKTKIVIRRGDREIESDVEPWRSF